MLEPAAITKSGSALRSCSAGALAKPLSPLTGGNYGGFTCLAAGQHGQVPAARPEQAVGGRARLLLIVDADVVPGDVVHTDACRGQPRAGERRHPGFAKGDIEQQYAVHPLGQPFQVAEELPPHPGLVAERPGHRAAGQS
jgi:hypothetical protein